MVARSSRRRHRRARPVGGLIGRLPTADREALAWWLLTRLSVVVLVAVGAGLLTDGTRSFVELWDRWDTGHFEQVATVWYSGQQPDGYPLEAFFPGFPAAMWLVSAAGVSLVAAGLIVSALSGGVAMVALRRLGDIDGPAGTGSRAVLLLLTSPFAFFLFAAYTEALFLAFALPAWLSARRGNWWAAALLAAGASAVRVNGLFLAAALVVQFVVTDRDRAPWRRLPVLAVPLVPPALFSAYLWWHTGDPLRWLTAQGEGWHRDFHWPWDAWANTWALAFPGPEASDYWAWASRFDLAAVVLAVVLTVALVVHRRWGEATWVALHLASMATSTWFLSVNRATLLWWPLWIGLAAIAGRRRWVLWAYLATSVPLLVAWTMAFTMDGVWAG